MTKKFLILMVLLYSSVINAAVCKFDSSGWSSSAYSEIKPAEIYQEGLDELNDASLEMAFFAITEFYLAMQKEKLTGLKFARVNAVSAALDYELNRLEKNVYEVSKMKSEIINTRIEASLLLNEIQLAIIAIKSNKVISNEKARIFH